MPSDVDPTSSDFSLEIRREIGLDKEWIEDTLIREWGSAMIERTGEFVDATKLSAFVAEVDDIRVGLATMLVKSGILEIVTFNCSDKGRGIGSEMLKRIEAEASQLGCDYVQVFTSNDNLDALRFYQRRGFRLEMIWKDSITEARKVKTSIPKEGHYGIPLCDEIELLKDVLQNPV